MREILFRGKRADNGEWVQSGNLIHFVKDGSDFFFMAATGEDAGVTVDASMNIIGMDPVKLYFMRQETIGQYTGLMDKNGKMIFEGDIIEAPEYADSLGVVCFGNHPPHVSHLEGTATGFYIKWHGESDGLLRTDIGYWVDHAERTVVGNIYDNPELLSGDEEDARVTADH